MNKPGVLVPIVTPCTIAGEVDFEGLNSVAQYVLEAGCHGFLVLGSTGRGPWFSHAERIRICRTIRDVMGNDKPLWAGCMDTGLPRMLDHTHAMKDAGADAAVITVPGYFKYNAGELEKLFLNLADHSPLPVVLYDIPVFAGSQLDLTMVERLSGHDNITGFKDSSADIERFKRLAGVFADIPDFCLMQGKENLLAESLMLGAGGIIVSLVHLHPELFVDLYHAAANGQVEQAQRLQQTINQVKDLVEDCLTTFQESSALFHILHYFLVKKDVCRNIMLPHESDSPDYIQKAIHQMDDILSAYSR